MAYDAGRSGVSRGSVAMGIGILVLLLAALAGAFWWQAAEKARRTSPETIEAELLKDPLAGRLFTTIRQTHPKELGAFTKRMSVLMRAGSSVETVRQEAYQFLTRTAEGHARVVAQAPHAELRELRRTQKALLKALEGHDVMLCARFVMTGAVFVPEAQGEIRPLLVDANISVWKAAAAGRDRPAKRVVPKELPEAEGAMVVEALRTAGMSDADLQVFTSPYGMQSAPAWQQCAIGLFLWEGIDSMPADRADLVTAMILSQTN